MDINTNTNDILMELDGQRIARGLSYQDLADACGVSKSTIHRTLSGATEPTMQLIQAIAAAVQYKPAAPVMVPEECTQEAYIAYLKELLQRRDVDNDRHILQLQAHYNKLHRQDRRTIVVLGGILGIIVLFICALFAYDFAHLDRGWIQEYSNAHGYISQALENVWLQAHFM